jgi:hypothetical protein
MGEGERRQRMLPSSRPRPRRPPGQTQGPDRWYPARTRRHSIPKSLGEASGVGPGAPGLSRAREAGVSSSSPSTLRQAGRGEEGARPEAPRARRLRCRVPLFLGASSRAIASRGRLGLQGGGGERRARGAGGGLLPGSWAPASQEMGLGTEAAPLGQVQALHPARTLGRGVTLNAPARPHH